MPILRSRHLAEMLTLLLLHPDTEYTLSELAASSVFRSPRYSARRPAWSGLRPDP